MKKINRKNVLIGVGIAVVIILLLIVITPSKKPPQIVTEETTVNEPKSFAEPTEEKETVLKKIIYSDSELCENHVMKQGDTIEIDGNSVKLIKIGQVSVRISINGKEVILPEGDSVYEKGLNVELSDDDFIFFGEDDEENRVEFTIGCKTDEDPTEKHILNTIENRGKDICEALIKSCEQEFDIE